MTKKTAATRWPHPALLVTFSLVAILALTGKPATFIDTYSTPPAADVHRNPFLALQRMAEQLDVHSASHARLTTTLLQQLPPTNATLLLPIPGRMLGNTLTQQLLAWVQAGGRLVLMPRSHALWKNDPLPLAGGIEFIANDEDYLLDVFGEDEEDEGTPGLPYPMADAWHLRGDFFPEHVVESTQANASHLLCDPAGCHAVSVPLGDGQLLALSEGHFLANNELGNYDHAAMARTLLQLQAGNTLWIVYEEHLPSLLELLWQHAWPALLAGMTATLLWALAGSTRFGPMLPSPLPARRRLAEHVEAAGLLLARHGAQHPLWQAARNSFLRTLHRRYPQSRDADIDTLVTLLTQQGRLDEAGVRAALTAPDPDNPAALTTALRQLDILERTL